MSIVHWLNEEEAQTFSCVGHPLKKGEGTHKHMLMVRGHGEMRAGWRQARDGDGVGGWGKGDGDIYNKIQ